MWTPRIRTTRSTTASPIAAVQKQALDFLLFLETGFFRPLACFCWTGLAKITVVCPARNREIFVKWRGKEKGNKRGEPGLFFVIMVLKAAVVLGKN